MSTPAPNRDAILAFGDPPPRRRLPSPDRKQTRYVVLSCVWFLAVGMSALVLPGSDLPPVLFAGAVFGPVLWMFGRQFLQRERADESLFATPAGVRLTDDSGDTVVVPWSQFKTLAAEWHFDHYDQQTLCVWLVTADDRRIPLPMLERSDLGSRQQPGAVKEMKRRLRDLKAAQAQYAGSTGPEELPQR